MGQFRLFAPDHTGPARDELAATAYVSGPDGLPVLSQAVWDAQSLILSTESPQSGRISAPWPHRATGRMMLSTTSLIQRGQPYLLPLELARGMNFRVRTMLASMNQVAMTAPATALELARASFQAFAAAATGKSDVQAATKNANLSISLSLESASQICQALADQLLARREQQDQRLFVGEVLDESSNPQSQLNGGDEFGAVSIPVRWNEVEHAPGEFNWNSLDRLVAASRERKRHVCLGPIMTFDSSHLPAWLISRIHEPRWLRERCLAWTEAVVRRFAHRTAIWNCVTTGGDADLAVQVAEDAQMAITAACLETARVLDPKSVRLVSIVDPWVQSGSRRELLHSPSSFAEALRRAETGLSAIQLNFCFGQAANEVVPRDLLELLYRIDLWSNVGAPLIAHVDASGIVERADSPSAQDQSAISRYVAAAIRLMASRVAVQGIFWRPSRHESCREHFDPNATVSHWFDREILKVLDSLPRGRQH